MARAYPVTASGVIGPQFPSKTNSSGGLETQGGFITLLGWSFRETGGTNPVGITLTDGGVSGGSKVGEAGCVASGSGYAWFGPQGVQVPVGLYVTKDGTGTLSGVIYVA